MVERSRDLIKDQYLTRNPSRIYASYLRNKIYFVLGNARGDIELQTLKLL